ncbi:MAG: 23S rRNA methyltransferase [Gammaproteobacteria bacterium]|nr:23S rRNA methyltransferase [Gammaproteobacteria bacterium]
MTRSKQSAAWLKRQVADPYVKQAQQQGWRSRAVFKLEEINRKHRLVKPNMVIVDLGAAPGGWSQFCAKKLKSNGRIIGIDLLPIEPIEGVDVLQGDFTNDAVLAKLIEQLGTQTDIDLVLSDMAPNLSGQTSVDIPRSYYLSELALDFAQQNLKSGGSFVVKLFQGEGFEPFIKQCRASFQKFTLEKPKASRADSREIYGVGLGLK